MLISDIKALIDNSTYRDDRDLHRLFEYCLSLYEQHRIDACELQSDGDMLLFQFGTYDWGDGEFFEIDLTRQITPTHNNIEASIEAMMQLSVTAQFLPNDENHGFGEQNYRCNHTDNLSTFTDLIFSSEAMSRTVNKKPVRIEVELEYI